MIKTTQKTSSVAVLFVQSQQKERMTVLECKIKKVTSFKHHEEWYLPPNELKIIKQVIEEALKNARHSVDPLTYYQEMKARYDKILELEKIDADCICGIKFSGNICYMPKAK